MLLLLKVSILTFSMNLIFNVLIVTFANEFVFKVVTLFVNKYSGTITSL